MSNLEQYYEFTSGILELFVVFGIAFCYVVWVKDFLADRRKAWLVGMVYAVLMLFFYFVPFYINGMLAHSVGVFAAFPVMLWIDREYAAQKLFLSTTFFCIRWQAWRIITSIGNEWSGWMYRTYPEKDAMFWFWMWLLDSLAEDLIAILLIYAAVRCLLRIYGRRREHMSIREFLLLSMSSVSGVFAYGILRYYEYVYERDSGRSIYDLYGGLDLVRLCYSLSCFVVILVTVYVFRQWKNEQEEDKRREVFSRQMQDLESHIGEVELLYRDMRRLRHDMGNHLMTIEQLYGKGEYEAAEKYAASLKEEMQNAATDIASGNAVTDVILSCRRKEMEEKGIEFACAFHYPENSEINAFDISIILNNALSNAVEAVERERECLGNGTEMTHVSLKSFRMKNMYIIEVSNSYVGEWRTDAQTGLPITMKVGDGHGFGLSNIRQAARKYLGDLEIGKEVCDGEERCVLRVMLQLTTDKSPSTTFDLLPKREVSK